MNDFVLFYLQVLLGCVFPSAFQMSDPGTLYSGFHGSSAQIFQDLLEWKWEHAACVQKGEMNV